MSYVCFNKIAIAGPRSKVLRFRDDAHRRLSQAVKESRGEPYMAFSLECLFRRNRMPIPSPDGIPFDAFRLGNDIVGGHYFTSRLPLAEWHGYARIEYSVEVKNYEIYTLLIPLSRAYAELCFVDSEISLESARHENDGLWVFLFCGLILKVCDTLRSGGPMPDPFPALIGDRSTLLRQISELGDFQPGSITSATRRCGSPVCHCAKPNDPGHGPHFQLTQKVEGKTVTQNLPSPAAVRKAEGEIAEFRKFQTLTGELVDVNRKICRLRPVEQTEQTAQEKKRRRPSNKKLPTK